MVTLATEKEICTFDEDELTQADVIFMYGYNPAAQWGAIKTGYAKRKIVIG